MLKFRPHHFLCTLGFEGKGYSEAFVRNYVEIAATLRDRPNGDDEKIAVVAGLDSICAPCPNNRGVGCETEAKIQKLDSAHSQLVGVAPGEILTWGEAKTRIAERVNVEGFNAACAPCSWRSLGVCEAALKRLKEARSSKTRDPQTKSGNAMASLSLAVLAALTVSSSGFSAVETDVTGLKPIDALQESLYKTHHSKTAKTVKQAYDLLQKKKYEEARKLASGFAKDKTFGDYSLWIAATAHRAQAEQLLKSKKDADAAKAAEKAVIETLQIAGGYPYSPFVKTVARDVAVAELSLATANYGLKKKVQTLEVFERAFQRLMSSGFISRVRPEHLKAFGETCNTLQTETCVAWVYRLTHTYPRASEEMKALLKAAPMAHSFPKAPPTVSKLVQSYKAPDLDQVAFDAAMSEYFNEKYKDAVSSFRKFLDDFPRSTHRFRARYWLGQALTQRQDHEEAQKIFEELQRDTPLSYYGLLAAISTGKSVDAAIDAVLPQADPNDITIGPQELFRVKRAERLIAEKAYDLVSFELKDFNWKANSSNQFLMYMAMLSAEAKNFPTAFSILTDLIQRGERAVFTSYGVRLIFPDLHWTVVQKQAGENQIDPVLVLSLIKQESAFDSAAVSGSGAMGLMQLMPTTASDTMPSIERADLTEVEPNIRVGTKYLRKLLQRFNGNIVYSLAGYNAGPNAVDRWIREAPQKRGMLEFIEGIPYKETRDYVSSIIRNYFWYSKKLGTETPKNLNFFWGGDPNAKKPAVVQVSGEKSADKSGEKDKGGATVQPVSEEEPVQNGN